MDHLANIETGTFKGCKARICILAYDFVSFGTLISWVVVHAGMGSWPVLSLAQGPGTARLPISPKDGTAGDPAW